MIHKLWDAFKKGPIVFHPSNFKATQAEKSHKAPDVNVSCR